MLQLRRSHARRTCVGLFAGTAAPGPPPPVWNPGDSTPLDWLDAGADASTYTLTTKLLAVRDLNAPVGALVPAGGPAGDWQQVTTARRPRIGVLGADQAALVFDHGDDAIGRVSNYPSAAGAKSLGIRVQYNATIGASDVDVLLVLGGTTRGFQVRIGGPSSASPGLSFAADLNGPTVSRRVSTWQPPGTDPFSLVIVYKGGGNTVSANYAVFVNGVELVIDTTGASFDVSSTSYVLNSGPVSSPVNGRFSKLCVVAEDKAATHQDIRDWLEAPTYTPAWGPHTPADPLWWHEVEIGRIWQESTATTPATAAGHPVGNLRAKYGTDFTQASATLRPYLAPFGADSWAAESDDFDDNLGNTATLTAGAKTIIGLFRVYSAPGASSAETVFRLGASPAQVIVRIAGTSSSSAKGWHVGVDRTSSNAVCVQGSAPELLSVGIHSIVIRYDGVSATAASSYRIWIDGVEITPLATGGNVAANGNTRWLATSAAAEVFNGAVVLTLVWQSAISEADCIAAAAWLEARR